MPIRRLWPFAGLMTRVSIFNLFKDKCNVLVGFSCARKYLNNIDDDNNTNMKYPQLFEIS